LAGKSNLEKGKGVAARCVEGIRRPVLSQRGEGIPWKRRLTQEKRQKKWAEATHLKKADAGSSWVGWSKSNNLKMGERP